MRVKNDIATLVATLVAALALSCGNGKDETDERACNDGGSGTALSGSYCEDIEMAYTEVKVLKVMSTPPAIRIEYLRTLGASAEKTLQIILNGGTVVIEADRAIDLLAADAHIRRLLPAGNVDLTPDLDPAGNQTLTFSEYTAEIGTNSSGTFTLLFKNGRTLSGEFEGLIEDARPTP